MKKNLLVILLATFAAGTISADEGGGFFSHLGEGIEKTFEGAGKVAASPTHIGQKSKKEIKEEQKKKNAENKKSKDQESKRRRARRRQKSEDAE